MHPSSITLYAASGLLAVMILLVGPPTRAQPVAPSDTNPFIHEWQTVYSRLISLAEAVPSETYDWRPTAEVDSFREVFLHVAATNYRLLGQIGIAPPDGINPGEMTPADTDKQAVIRYLKQSRDHILTAVKDYVTGSRNYTSRPERIYLRGLTHASHHLGQLTAYSRSNNIVPPWSR